MRRSTAIIFAALVSSSAALPALAAWDRVGTVDFSRRDTHDAKLGNFKGYAMGLTARGSDLLCDRVVATFGNGRSREIFQGELPRGRTVTIDLPGSQSSVDRLDFDCRPTDNWRGTVDIAADTGGGYRNDYPDRYRNDYPGFSGRLGSPDYGRLPDDGDYYGRPSYWDRN